MKINELTSRLKEHDIINFEEFEIKKYVPIMKKKKFVIGVIAACTDDSDGFIQVDRFKINIYFHINMLSLYTNLEQIVDFNEMVEQYDALCEYGMINTLINEIGDDYDELQDVLECELNSLTSQNSIDFQVVKIANKINYIIDIFSDKLEDLNLDDVLPEGANVTSIADMLNLLK